MTDSKNDAPEHDDTHDDLDSDWAAAMSEQNAGTATNQAQGLDSHHPDQADAATDHTQDGDPVDSDDWAAALAEQTAATSKSDAQKTLTEHEPASTGALTSFLKPLTPGSVEGQSDIDMIMDIPVQLTVELGRTRLTIKNILQLGQGSIVELDGLAGEPMDIYVNGYLIAQGEVVVVNDQYGIRVTDIITPSDRINRLNTRR